MLRNLQLRSGVTSFLFMFLIQAGIFFTVPLFLSVALGLSAVETGVRLLPLSLSLLLFAARHPEAVPGRVTAASRPPRVHGAVRRASCCWSRLLDVGVGPEIVTWPLLLAGAGLGALASQLGAVTVSAVPDEKSGEVGGLQNTGTQLGASIGTALAGAVLISALTASFLTGIQNNPDVPDSVVSQAQTELAGGIPFMSDDRPRRPRSPSAHVPPRRPTRSSTRTRRAGSTGCAAPQRSSRSSRSSPSRSPAASRRSNPAPNRSPARRRHKRRPRGGAAPCGKQRRPAALALSMQGSSKSDTEERPFPRVSTWSSGPGGPITPRSSRETMAHEPG